MTRVALLLALLTGACASSGRAPISYGDSVGARAEQGAAPQRVERRGRAPIEQRGGQREQPQAEAPAPIEQRAPAVQEQPNWADGEGTPLSAYALQPEQTFDPANLPRTHRVSGDESLYDIATRYQLPLRALIDQNHLEPPYTLGDGRVLDLPPPRFHVVRRGESLTDIAQRYNVDLRSLALLNRRNADDRVRAGDRIYLPALARELAAPEPAPTPVATAPLPQGSGRFAWPLRGDVVARFGAQPGGTRLDGIEIAAREGDRVSAAAEGDVIYAGADIEGLGTLILIRHADNYVTAYGYNRRALVREGQRVRAGEAIGEVGARPDGHARLLFQVRRGNEALDPAPMMSAQR
ncbi:MAG: peptidoglycan DD-metalloendopeptidase family protein [Caulobacteraceae bacterium]|nr:peptidoglycan DD-metalloendopeptidase family protein [Caulobacteraceae bacterium]